MDGSSVDGFLLLDLTSVPNIAPENLQNVDSKNVSRNKHLSWTQSPNCSPHSPFASCVSDMACGIGIVLGTTEYECTMRQSLCSVIAAV